MLTSRYFVIIENYVQTLQDLRARKYTQISDTDDRY